MFCMRGWPIPGNYFPVVCSGNTCLNRNIVKRGVLGNMKD
jgi:hypothetical protein